MADDVTFQSATLATPASGEKFAFLEAGAKKYGRGIIALADATTIIGNLAGRVITGTEGALYVDLRRKFTPLRDASSGLTIASTNYTAGDQVGAIQSMANAFRAGVLSGTITMAQIVDAADVCPVTGGYDIYLWQASVTVASDNAAGPGASDADMLKLVNKIEMPAFRDEGANRLAVAQGAWEVWSDDTTLYYSLVTRADHNFFAAATDLQVSFALIPD